jgi:hypothetical protein
LNGILEVGGDRVNAELSPTGDIARAAVAKERGRLEVELNLPTALLAVIHQGGDKGVLPGGALYCALKDQLLGIFHGDASG